MEQSLLNFNYLKYWNSIQPLTDKESSIFQQLLERKYKYNDIQNAFSQEECNSLFSKYLLDISTNTQQKFYSFKETATEHIHDLFQKYVDDSTIIISTTNEHGNVQKELDERNKTNKIVQFTYDEIQRLDLSKIDELDISSNTTFFIYCASVWITQGINVDEMFIEQLKYKFRSYKIIVVLDDVQGMFLYPRRYELYDYIIGTAHALIRGFNMGILISHNIEDNKQLTNINLNYYFQLLDIMLKRKEKMFQFKFIMTQTLKKLINKYNWKILDSVPTYFSAETNLKYSEEINMFFRKKYNIFIEFNPNDTNQHEVHLRFRGAQFIEFQKDLEPGLKLLEQYLELNLL